MIEKVNFEKMNGLVPAIVQDADDGIVLMVGFMNKEALEQTIKERQVTFWSRSKSRLWKKGETSGNVMHVVSIDVDCDADSVLIRAHPAGPVCHTGTRSCFPPSSSPESAQVLARLFSIIQDRKRRLPEQSYTSKLFREGTARIAQKVGEEAVELAIAAQFPDQQRIIEETADLFYHAFVLLVEKKIDLSQVYEELAKRMK